MTAGDKGSDYVHVAVAVAVKVVDHDLVYAVPFSTGLPAFVHPAMPCGMM